MASPRTGDANDDLLLLPPNQLPVRSGQALLRAVAPRGHHSEADSVAADAFYTEAMQAEAEEGSCGSL